MSNEKERKNMICKKCEHTYFHEFDLPKSVEEVILDIQSLKCPSCGAGYRNVSISLK